MCDGACREQQPTDHIAAKAFADELDKLFRDDGSSPEQVYTANVRILYLLVLFFFFINFPIVYT